MASITLKNQTGGDAGSVDLERNLLLVKGGIPGAEGGLVIVRPTVKVGK